MHPCPMVFSFAIMSNYVKNIVHEFKQQITEISEAVTLEMLKHVWSEACYQLHICRATKGVCVEVH